MADEVISVKEILYTAAYRQSDMDYLLDEENPKFIHFNPDLGYHMSSHKIEDGMGGTLCDYEFVAPGNNRNLVNYADKPCRINTYGDSFTMCAQVSSGETWQEVLAAHLHEPVRNFGVGGYGVYAAYNKAMQIENTDMAADYIVMNVWDDDHLRNLDAARWIRSRWKQRHVSRVTDTGVKPYPIHGFPWPHVRFDPASGEFTEHRGAAQNVEELKQFADQEFFYQTYKDDHVVHLFTLTEGGEAPVDELEKLAEGLGVKVDLRTPETLQAEAIRFHWIYGMRATQFIIGKLDTFAKENGRTLIVLMSYDTPTVETFLKEGTRFDEEMLSFLSDRQIRHVDMLSPQGEDFKIYNLSVEQYLARFYIPSAGAQVFGHYNPYGNFWFARNLRKPIVSWLDPKPEPYAEADGKEKF